MSTKNPIRRWLEGQPREVSISSLAQDLDIDRSYLSHLMQEDNHVMPGLPFILRMVERTRDGPNPVGIEELAAFIVANKKKQRRAA